MIGRAFPGRRYGGRPYNQRVGTLGDNIRRFREALDLTQDQLAAAVGTTQPTVNNWERGRRQDVHLPTLVALAKALKVTIDALVAGIDEDYDRWREGRAMNEEVADIWARLPERDRRLALDLMRSLADRPLPDRQPAAPSDEEQDAAPSA